MNRTHRFAAAAAFALLGASSAFAGGEFDPMTGFGPVGQSSLTRAQVRAEVVAARATGTETVQYDRGNAFAVAPAAGSGLTRAEVKAEFARARAAGDIVDYDHGNVFATAPASTLTREEVREQTRLAVRARGVRGS